MSTLFAQPYNIDATGFYFDNVEDYEAKVKDARDSLGLPVEEFEIQFIDGESIDVDLFEALSVYQGNLERYFDAVDNWDEYEKLRVIIACNECSYTFDQDSRPGDFDVDIYEMSTLKELAEHFVDEGLYGEIPDSLRFYIDFDAIGRDLGMDYGQTRIGGKDYIFRCG